MSNYKVFYRSVKSADTHHRVNEDCYMHVQYYMMNDAKINVLAVADGMGGLSNGETASRSAVAGALESVHRELLRRYQDSRGKNFSMTHHIEWLEAAARTALEDANEAVCATAEPGVETGTTLSLLLHMGDCAVAAMWGIPPSIITRQRKKNWYLYRRYRPRRRWRLVRAGMNGFPRNIMNSPISS